MTNLILKTDSYKLTHYNQYPDNTEGVYSYFEARKGAQFDETVFFGLLPILEELAGKAVTQSDVDAAAKLAAVHFGDDTVFNRAGWEYIVNELDGHLPVRIKAIPEGTVVPVDNVMMTVENTDPNCYWLTNALESVLTHVWYPMTVATKSRETKKLIRQYLDYSADSDAGLPFMLHDFGYRGATTDSAAAIGGAGHLVNFLGTDTLPAMELAMETYNADLDSLAFSVQATEHSVMTALGKRNQYRVVEKLLRENPSGILSVVIDSYDSYDFVHTMCNRFKDDILARDGKFVFRPDSNTEIHPEPGDQVVWILRTLEQAFGSTTNEKGFRVLDSHVGVLWGDGIDYDGIEKILKAVTDAKFSAENMVFGQGGGLLQKVNRDTQRCAFKSSAQKIKGEDWREVKKNPLDASKASKGGRLVLSIESDPHGPYDKFVTNQEGVFPHDHMYVVDALVTVFENGEIKNRPTFAEIRERAKL